RGGAIYSWETDEYSADGQVETGIVDNLAWLAINGNHPSGNGSYWPETHGMIIFNPLNNGYTWNIDNNVTTIPYNSVDLYSTTLHELLHVLGFDSAIGSDGESTLEFNGNNSATLNLYTRYDTYLKNSVNNNLVQNPDIVGDPYNWDFAGVIGDLTAISGCSVTFQDVASNSLSPIYTPANFINNQSLKHLLNDCTTPYPNYVMDPIVQGVVHRIPTVEEINMLCALGYHTTGIYGNQTVTDPCFKHIPVGRWEYGKNCSPLPSERFKITMCPGQESIDIAYSDILYNDVNVIDGTTTIVGLNVYDITQPGLEVTVTSYADHFTVAAQNTGIIDIDNAEIKLKYVPVTTMPNGDILYGNVTYVGILLNSCCYPIIPPYELTGCNLIPNPTLVIEDISNCNQNNYILKHNIGNYNYCVAGWGRLHHRPGSVPASILEEEATNVWSLPNLLNPVGYNMIRQVTTGITAAEGLALNDQEISITQVPVKTGKNYILSFLFCAANGVHQEITLDDYDVYLINSSDIQENCNYQQAPTQQVFTLPEPVNYPTKQGISCFTATQDWNNLFLKPINNTPQGIISFTTRLTLVEDVDKIIFESLDNTTTNATYSCGDNNSTITLFEPSLCSDITIAYTVTGSNGFSEVFINEPLVIPTPDCTTNYTITRSVVPWNTDYPEIQEAYDLLTSDGSQSLCSPPISITVVVQQVTSDVFTLSDDNVCVGESVTITANSNFSEATEHLYVNGTEVTINANHQYIYTPTTSGIIQVGFTWSNPGCCSAAYTQSITVNPLPTANITGNLSICSGQSTTLTANGGGTYTWSTTPQTTTAQITVSAGTYTVTVTTAQGCSATASATVAVNPLP
ncbi:MAG TPA: hypothetical protein PK230_05920, partial [Chitinophagales bacterium]|nr:hypothetical protein [Chitinophagales bacterium]